MNEQEASYNISNTHSGRSPEPKNRAERRAAKYNKLHNGDILIKSSSRGKNKLNAAKKGKLNHK